MHGVVQKKQDLLKLTMVSDNETLSTRYIEEQDGKLISSKDYESLMSYEAWKLAWIPEGRYSEFQWLTSHGRDDAQAMDVLDEIGMVHDPLSAKTENVMCGCFACMNFENDYSLKYLITKFKKLVPFNKQDDYEARILGQHYLPALLQEHFDDPKRSLPGGYKSPEDIYYAVLEDCSEEEKEQESEFRSGLYRAYSADQEIAAENYYLQELDRRAKRIQRIMTWFNVKEWALDSKNYLELTSTLEKMQAYLDEAKILDEWGQRSIGLYDLRANLDDFDDAVKKLREKWAYESHS
jgi:hypothetical protein